MHSALSTQHSALVNTPQSAFHVPQPAAARRPVLAADHLLFPGDAGRGAGRGSGNSAAAINPGIPAIQRRHAARSATGNPGGAGRNRAVPATASRARLGNTVLVPLLYTVAG